MHIHDENGSFQQIGKKSILRSLCSSVNNDSAIIIDSPVSWNKGVMKSVG